MELIIIAALIIGLGILFAQMRDVDINHPERQDPALRHLSTAPTVMKA